MNVLSIGSIALILAFLGVVIFLLGFFLALGDAVHSIPPKEQKEASFFGFSGITLFIVGIILGVTALLS